jgi:hypothetical protein
MGASWTREIHSIVITETADTVPGHVAAIAVHAAIVADARKGNAVRRERR